MGVVDVRGACGSGQCGSEEREPYLARTMLSVQSQYPGGGAVLALPLNGTGTKVCGLLPKEGLGDWNGINRSGLDKRLERPSKPLLGSQLQGH